MTIHGQRMQVAEGDIVECQTDPSLGKWLVLEPVENVSPEQSGWRLVPLDDGPAGPTDAALEGGRGSWAGTARCGYAVHITDDALAALQASRVANLSQFDLERTLLLRMKLEQGVEIRNPIAEIEAQELQRDTWVRNVVLPRVLAMERAELGLAVASPCVVVLLFADMDTRRRLFDPLSALVEAAYPRGANGWVRASVQAAENAAATITVSPPIDDGIPFRVPLVQDDATWAMFERNLSQAGSTPSPRLVETLRHLVATAASRLYLTVPWDSRVVAETWFWGVVVPAALNAIAPSSVETTAQVQAAFRLAAAAPEAWRPSVARVVGETARRVAIPTPAMPRPDQRHAVLGERGGAVTFVAAPSPDSLAIVCARPELRDLLLLATDTLDDAILS